MSYPRQPGQYWAGPPGQPGRFEPGPPGGGPGFPPSFPGGGPPKRRNTGAIAAIVVMAVLVLGGAVTAVLVLTGDDEPSGEQTSAADGSTEPAVDDVPSANNAPVEDPADTGGGESAALTAAQAYVDAIAAKDETAATDLTCDKAGPGGLYEIAGSADWDLELTGEVEITTYGTATVEVTITTSYGNQNDAPGLLLEDRNGWCVPV